MNTETKAPKRRPGRPTGRPKMDPYVRSSRVVGLRVNGPEAATIGALADVLELDSESDVLRLAIGSYYAGLPGEIRNKVDSVAAAALEAARQGHRPRQRQRRRGIGAREDPRLGFASAAAIKILDKPTPVPRGPRPKRKPDPPPGEEFFWL
jgi:hypothetical protein